MLFQFALVRQNPVQTAIQASVVDLAFFDFQQIVQRSRGIPAFLDRQLAARSAQSVDGQHRRHPGPRHLDRFLIHRLFKKTIFCPVVRSQEHLAPIMSFHPSLFKMVGLHYMPFFKRRDCKDNTSCSAGLKNLPDSALPRRTAVSTHAGKDIGRGVIEVNQNVAGVVLLGIGQKIDVITLLVTCAQKAHHRSTYQLTRIPHSFSWTRLACDAVNQADEVESIRHGRELAADSIPGKKESAIEHGDENAIEAPRNYNEVSVNGNNPLNSVSQSRGAPHCAGPTAPSKKEAWRTWSVSSSLLSS